jgi:hypothetical protein
MIMVDILNCMTEEELCKVAESHEDDSIANSAMRLLRDNFDKTYFWCQDCDGLVTKASQCCLNQECEILDDDFDI